MTYLATDFVCLFQAKVFLNQWRHFEQLGFKEDDIKRELIVHNNNKEKVFQSLVAQVSPLQSWSCFANLRGTAPPTSKLACFVLFLKIINIFLKNDIFILW